ncbi:MAG: molybdenum cofactor biosynthesis protein MoaE [Weeksellaceae bacterium]|nr:molybdenum cofactor biosynthesis protein MoaE [Weeksellaceae bacterium]
MSHKKNYFVEGAIPPSKIAESIAHHSHKTDIGAHSIFLGQVRADKKDQHTVQAIEFSCYPEMAEEKISQIREDIFQQIPEITCMHIYHSIGHVNAGELCFFVFTSSAHRKEAFQACQLLVERFKAEVPLWGKEILDNDEHLWKENR